MQFEILTELQILVEVQPLSPLDLQHTHTHTQFQVILSGDPLNLLFIKDRFTFDLKRSVRCHMKGRFCLVCCNNFACWYKISSSFQSCSLCVALLSGILRKEHFPFKRNIHLHCLNETIPASALALKDPLITSELKLDHLNKFKNNKVIASMNKKGNPVKWTQKFKDFIYLWTLYFRLTISIYYIVWYNT